MSGPAPPRGLASIVVPCFDRPASTRACVAAPARHTRTPREPIAVDYGSTDGIATSTSLDGVRDAAPSPTTIATNSANRGFPAASNRGLAASNRGLAAARGDDAVLLNHDAVATDGRLDGLVALADAAPAIGMAGPMSNHAGPPQLVPDAPYEDMDGMRRFAGRWRRERRGSWTGAVKLSGSCPRIERRVIGAIGGLDERSGVGLFDDDDLAPRARRAGFDLAVAPDLFVHHFGSRTFAGAGLDAGALLEANRERFEAKWGTDAAPAHAVTLTPRADVPRPEGRGAGR